MDYLEKSAIISAEAKFTESETELFIRLTSPLSTETYDFIQLYQLFEKLIRSRQGGEACELYKEKQRHYELDPSAYPELEEDVRVG